MSNIDEHPDGRGPETSPHGAESPGVRVGESFTFRKTVSESDVYLFAGITGDLHPNHVDEQYMQSERFGRRIAHGGLVLGLSSNTSTAMVTRIGKGAVAYGYDQVRFIQPVYLGDTVTITYRVSRIDRAKSRIYSEIIATNQRDETVMAATHLVHLTEKIDS